MALLKSILQHKPSKWDENTYDDQTYARVTLKSTSSEYKQIKSKFEAKYGVRTIIKLQRVQHPFAYFRFKIRREHLAKIHGNKPAETRKFFRIRNKNKIDRILEFNCDPRIGGCSYNSNSSLSNEHGYVIVVKTLTGYGFNDRDTHHYPECLIKYGPPPIEDLMGKLSIH